jgi:hypothetical protein
MLHPTVHGEELLRVLVVVRELLVALELARESRVLGGDLRRALQKPGSPIWASSSVRRAASASGSKVITDPGQLGPDFLELFAQRLCVLVCHEFDGSQALRTAGVRPQGV